MATAPGSILHYYMRAIDSSTGTWVYWDTTDPTATPAKTTTTPNYVGTLSTFVVLFTYVSVAGSNPAGLILNFVQVGPTQGSLFPKITAGIRVPGFVVISPVASTISIITSSYYLQTIGPGPGVPGGGEVWLYTGSQANQVYN